MEMKWVIAGTVLAGIIVGTIVIGTHTFDNKSRYIYQGSPEAFTLDKTLPESPATAPIYRVISTDSIFEGTLKSMAIKNNTPSEAEAPVLAEKLLEKYGGLPKDAVLYKVERVSMKKYNTKTNITEQEYPEFTQVIYIQQINGAPVIGPGAEINIELGENGELLWIEKAWRHLEYAGEVPIISSEAAYEKLKKGETLHIYQSGVTGLRISDIKIGYYAEHRDKDQKYYTPVWIFYAAKEGKQTFPYLVDAVKTN